MSVELSDPISMRLPVDVLEAIERVAEATDRNRSWVMVRALRRYLATEGRHSRRDRGAGADRCRQVSRHG
jgi:predicted transcriptional regulator